MHICCTYDCLYLLILLRSLISMYACYLLIHTYSCLCFVAIAYAAHACLCLLSICLWVTILVREFSVGLRGMEGREVVLYQEKRIYVYKRTYPPSILSFLLFLMQHLVFLFNTTISLLSLISSLAPSAQPSQAPSCPRPALPSLPSLVPALALL
jgi:hypothetical protein